MTIKFKIPLTPGYLRYNLADGQSDTISIRLVAYLPQSKIGQSCQGSPGAARLITFPDGDAAELDWCYTLHIGMQCCHLPDWLGTFSFTWTRNQLRISTFTLRYLQVNILNWVVAAPDHKLHEFEINRNQILRYSTLLKWKIFAIVFHAIVNSSYSKTPWDRSIHILSCEGIEPAY